MRTCDVRSIRRPAVLLVAALLVVAIVAVGVQRYGHRVVYSITHRPYDAPVGAPRVAFLGDSYVEGSLQDSGRQSQWPDLVSRRMKWNQRDFAEGGSGYAVAGLRGHTIADNARSVVAWKPQVVVVEGGLNDDSPAAMRAGLRRTLDRLWAGLPQADIVVLTNFVPGAPGRADLAKKVVIEQVTAERDVATVDVTGMLAAGGELIGSDRRHPTDEGHRLLAREIRPVLADALDRQGSSGS